MRTQFCFIRADGWFSSSLRTSTSWRRASLPLLQRGPPGSLRFASNNIDHATRHFPGSPRT
jgi:hypothetical protein